MSTNTAIQKAVRLRRKAVETEYLAGYTAAVIQSRLFEQFPVQPNTIRKDIVAIRKAWKADVDEADEFEGRHRWLASCREVRERAMTGWIEEGKFGPVIKGVDLSLAHTIDEKIAKLSGVDLKIGERTLNINLQAAIMHMEGVLGAVFSVIPDQTIQNQIIEAIEIAAE